MVHGNQYVSEECSEENRLDFIISWVLSSWCIQWQRFPGVKSRQQFYTM